MSYRWIEHTAEVEMEIDAATEEAVFAEALAAFAELVGGDGEDDDRVSRGLVLAEVDRPTLLVLWLDELVFLVETEDLVPEAVEGLTLEDGGLHATLHCRRGTPRHLVKGVTYHRLTFESSDGGYRATVVLDV